MWQDIKDFLNHGGVAKACYAIAPIATYFAATLPKGTTGQMVATAVAGICGALAVSSNPNPKAPDGVIPLPPPGTKP